MLPPGTPDTRAYHGLSLVALVAMGLFLWFWFTMSGVARTPVLYGIVTGAILYYLGVWVARWSALRRMSRPAPLTAQPGARVAVATTFVPAAEPLTMLETTLRALLRLDYPHDTWVLDEGGDPQVRELCDRLGARYYSRLGDPRYRQESGPFAADTKYGNYNAWLTQEVYGRYDYVVCFDPDHVPLPAYLTETLGYFQDPEVGYVQAPPVIYNQEAGFIARGAAEEGYAYYSSHQMASYAFGHPIIVGSHCVHRVEALREIGGFPAHDAEDLYLTMLYRASEWRGVYVPKILALGTTPVNWHGYLRQQVRWARAVIDLKIRVLPSLLKRLPVLERFLNLFHGVYYLRSIAFFALWLALLAMLLRGVEPAFLEASVLAAVLGLFMVLGLVDRFRHRFFFDRVREGGTHWRALVLQVAKWPHLVQAIGEALMSRRTGYAITWKAENGHAPRALTKPQLLVAAVTAVAAVAGTLLRGPLPRDLYALAGSVVLVSVLLVWTESWKSSAPFDARLLERRRRELGFPIDDLRGAPVVERRSAERRQGPSALPVHATIPERRQGERRGRTESLNSAGRRHPHPRRGSRDARAAG